MAKPHSPAGARKGPPVPGAARPGHRLRAAGSGTVVKLVTNQIWFINAAAIGEALVLGKKAGIELTVLWNALKSGAGDSFVARRDVPSIFAGHYDHRSRWTCAARTSA